MKFLSYVSLFVIALMFLTGCQTKVPTGHYGMCRDGDGFVDSEPLAPGYHSCWGVRQEMYYLEVTDFEKSIPMSVLCKDNLNFKFNVSVLAAVDRDNPKQMKDMFENLKPEGDNNTVTADQVFSIYAKRVVDQEARKVVSKYETSEIVSNRKQIIGEIHEAVTSALDGSVIKVKRVTVNNLDFPTVLTQAQEDRAKRQIEIETERAEQKKRLLKAENELKIAEMDYKIQLVEAATIADFNKIIGESLRDNPEFLSWWQLKVFSEAAKGPNNWGFIPYTDHVNSPQSTTAQSVVLDEELRTRIREARTQAQKPTEVVAAPETAPVETP